MKLTFFYPQRNAGTGAEGSGYDPNGIGFRMRPASTTIQSGIGDGLPNADEEAKKQEALRQQQQNQDKPDPNKFKPEGKENAPEGKFYNEKGELVDDPNFKKPEEKKDDK